MKESSEHSPEFSRNILDSFSFFTIPLWFFPLGNLLDQPSVARTFHLSSRNDATVVMPPWCCFRSSCAAAISSFVNLLSEICFVRYSILNHLQTKKACASCSSLWTGSSTNVQYGCLHVWHAKRAHHAFHAPLHISLSLHGFWSYTLSLVSDETLLQLFCAQASVLCFHLLHVRLLFWQLLQKLDNQVFPLPQRGENDTKPTLLCHHNG